MSSSELQDERARLKQVLDLPDDVIARYHRRQIRADLNALKNPLNTLDKLDESVSVKIPAGYDVSLKPQEPEPDRKQNTLFPFSPIRTIKMKYAKPYTDEDIFDLLGQVTKAAYDLFIELKLNTTRKDNLCHYPIDGFNHSQTNSFNNKMKQLITVGVFKRAKTIDLKHPVKPHTFMLNPYLIKPPKKTAEIQENWDLL